MDNQTKYLSYLIGLVAAQAKAEAVIESCVNNKQCVAAKKYIDLYFDKFKDINGYGDLMTLYIDKTFMLNS